MSDKKPTVTAYLAVRGFDYEPGVRVEPGEICTDLPKRVVTELLRMGAITPTKAKG
jgi:hypothetical protein